MLARADVEVAEAPPVEVLPAEVLPTGALPVEDAAAEVGEVDVSGVGLGLVASAFARNWPAVWSPVNEWCQYYSLPSNTLVTHQ